MIWLALVLLILGVGLSAFFSGSETGFYRARRVRIVMDALDGNWPSKFLLFLTNRPPLFVATALIGNNLANYMTSMAVVIGTGVLYPSDSAAVELIAPILMSPFLYVYGESLPKNIFFLAPNRLLKFFAPVLLMCTILFAPIALVLWGLAWVLERLLGESPDIVRLALARKELQQVLDEGKEAGILHPTQRLLADNFFTQAARKVREIYTPLPKAYVVPQNIEAAELGKIASRKGLADIAVYGQRKSDILGYYRLVELFVKSPFDQEMTELPELHPIKEVNANELMGEVLLQMQVRRETLIKVVDDRQQVIGILSMDQLTNPILNGPLLNLRR